MEKLILTYQVSDGYTYFYDVQLPVIYSSKEEFLIDLEDEVLKRIKKEVELRKELDSIIEKRTKDIKKSADKLLEYLQKEKEIYLKLEENEKLILNSQKFNVSNFLDENKSFSSSVKVETIDEYFQYVTKELEKKNEKKANM